MNAREAIDAKYKNRLYLRYLSISLVPFLFFAILGSTSLFFSQRYVSEELTRLSFRNLNQVRDTFELIINETDALALSMATDPGFNQTARQLLEKGIQTLDDSKVYRNFMDSLLTATNVRRYLHSLYLYNKYVPHKLITNTEIILDISKFYDIEWLSNLEDKKDEMRFWLSHRFIPLFPASTVSKEVLTLYRNILEPYTLESQGIILVNIKLDYVADVIRSISNSHEQHFLVLHPSLGTLVNTSKGWDPSKEILAKLTNRTESGETFVLKHEDVDYIIDYIVSNKHPLLYISIAPKETYYQLSYKLFQLTLFFSFGALLLGIVAIVYLTRRSFRNIKYICDIIEAAEKNLPVPEEQKHASEDSFYALTHNIVRTFLERNYLKLRQKTLELQALQWQMNPHFLFNTLTSISLRSMGYTGGPNDVTKMIDLLSRILDYSLESPQKEVLLKDEIQFTQYYLEIQSYRYPRRFRTKWDIEENTLTCKVMKLILQPIVENSISHGIDSGSKKKLSIRIKCRLEQNFLILTVEDTGCGISRERLEEVLKISEDPAILSDHIGLVNTYRRLKLFFGDSSEMQIESPLNNGTIVTLKIPAKQ